MQNGETRILEFLASVDEAQNVHSIAFATNLSYGYTRNLLSKMVREGKVVKIMRGWYIHSNAVHLHNALTMRPLKLHGLKIMAKRRRGIPFVTMKEVLRGSNVDVHKHRVNHAVVYNEVWRGRLITVTYHPEHTLLIDLRCSDKPVGFNEFEAFSGWLEGRFPSIVLGAWEVLQAGFNWDIIGMQLDGIESITMRVLREVWYRMYNKGRDILRVEAHTNIKIGLVEAIEALEGALDSIEKQVSKKIIVMKRD